MATLQEAVYALHAGKGALWYGRPAFIDLTGTLIWDIGMPVPIKTELLNNWTIISPEGE